VTGGVVFVDHQNWSAGLLRADTAQPNAQIAADARCVVDTHIRVSAVIATTVVCVPV